MKYASRIWAGASRVKNSGPAVCFTFIKWKCGERSFSPGACARVCTRVLSSISVKAGKQVLTKVDIKAIRFEFEALLSQIISNIGVVIKGGTRERIS